LPFHENLHSPQQNTVSKNLSAARFWKVSAEVKLHSKLRSVLTSEKFLTGGDTIFQKKKIVLPSGMRGVQLVGSLKLQVIFAE